MTVLAEKAERSGHGEEVLSVGGGGSAVLRVPVGSSLTLALGETGKSGQRTNPSFVRAHVSGMGTGESLPVQLKGT